MSVRLILAKSIIVTSTFLHPKAVIFYICWVMYWVMQLNVSCGTEISSYPLLAHPPGFWILNNRNDSSYHCLHTFCLVSLVTSCSMISSQAHKYQFTSDSVRVLFGMHRNKVCLWTWLACHFLLSNLSCKARSKKACIYVRNLLFFAMEEDATSNTPMYSPIYYIIHTANITMS